MQKKLASILFSTRLTATLFIVFAVAMAVGTLLDASQKTSPTPYTRELIYNAWWFEAIMLLFVINFTGNIFRFQLYKKEKWATLLLHLSFIFILVGAFVTRYIGFEGVMHIREGATENKILSSDVYLKTFIDGEYEVDGLQQRKNLPLKKLNLSERLDNNFKITDDYNNQEVTITYKNFIGNAEEDLVITEDGDQYLKIVEAGEGGRHDHWLKLGEVSSVHNILFAVNKKTEGAVNITFNEIDGSYNIDAPFDGTFMRMADQMQGTLVKDSIQPLMLRSLYQMAGMQFVIPDPMARGYYGIVKAETGEETSKDALILEVSSGGETKEVELLGGKGNQPDPVEVNVGGLKVYLSFGSKAYDLPFSLTLNDFIAEKYPGTEKGYKAFKSKVTVNSEDGSSKNEEIFMNNVLDKGGYRFFQASFDADEEGTILSVNHDRAGTWITYLGYFLLYFGLMAILFDKNTRFAHLKKMLDTVKKKKAKLITVLILFIAMGASAQEDVKDHLHSKTSKTQIDSLIKANAVTKEHAADFAKLVIQDNGRMKPVNTFASELLRKISGKDNYEGLDANQVFMSMTEFPRFGSKYPLLHSNGKMIASAILRALKREQVLFHCLTFSTKRETINWSLIFRKRPRLQPRINFRRILSRRTKNITY